MLNANPGQDVGIPRALSGEEALAEFYAAQGEGATARDHAVCRAEKLSETFPGKEVPKEYLANPYFSLATVECTLGDWNRAGAGCHRHAREQAETLLREAAAKRQQSRKTD